jgi:hypothetical protein
MRKCPLSLILTIVTIVSLKYAVSVSAGVDVRQVNDKDLLIGIKEAEAAIIALSVDCTIHGVTHDIAWPEVPVQLKRSESIIVEKDGRARCETDGQDFKIESKGKATVRPLKAISTFDGTACRSVRGRDEGRIGLVTSSRSDIFWILDPRQISTHYYDKLVSQIIEERGGRIVGSTQHNGRDVLVVETEPVARAQKKWNYRFLVDPALNFAVVKRSQLIQFPPSEKWIEVTSVTGYDYREASPGIWLPEHVVQTSFDPTEKDVRNGNDPRLSWEWNIQNTNWIVNPTVADSLFKLEFPPGTDVDDKVNGRVYKVAGVSDGMLTGQAELAQKWKLTGGRAVLILINAVVVLVLVAFCVVAWRRRRAPR